MAKDKKESEGIDLGIILGSSPTPSDNPETLEDLEIELGDDEGIDEDLEAAIAEIEMRISDAFEGDDEKASAIVDGVRDLVNLLIS